MPEEVKIDQDGSSHKEEQQKLILKMLGLKVWTFLKNLQSEFESVAAFHAEQNRENIPDILTI